jgi:hypothetical protein
MQLNTHRQTRLIGEPYYYYKESTDCVLEATYSLSEEHLTREAIGNMFNTYEEAKGLQRHCQIVSNLSDSCEQGS